MVIKLKAETIPSPGTFEEAEALLAFEQEKPLQPNTYLRQSGEDIELVFYTTPIVTYRPDGKIRLITGSGETGGKVSKTTALRMNEVLRQRGKRVDYAKQSGKVVGWFVLPQDADTLFNAQKLQDGMLVE